MKIYHIGCTGYKLVREPSTALLEAAKTAVPTDLRGGGYKLFWFMGCRYLVKEPSAMRKALARRLSKMGNR